VGVAVAGDLVRIGRLVVADGSFTNTADFNFSRVGDRVRCAKAAINIARYVSFANNSVLRIPLAYNTSHRDVEGRRTILITHTAVKKTYHTKSIDERKQLHTFYTECKAAPFVECALSIETAGADLILSLSPVGIAIVPDTVASLQMAMACTIIALRSVHSKRWAIIDLRWPNIVRVSTHEGYRYVLIDCEHATPFDAPISLSVRHAHKLMETASPAVDTVMLGRACHIVATKLGAEGRAALNFANSLMKGQHTVADADKHAFFTGFVWPSATTF